ncbi:MAG: hypothetical protein ABMA13_20390 [Chthoniobacteraceae bacterium]
MKTLLFLLLIPLLAHAHVGSPNVFFDGKAGPHSVRVVIRPPAALPGAAQIDVRVAGDGAERVTVQPVFWSAGESAAPEPTSAAAVDAHLFNASCWLLRRGSYALRIVVESPLGRGEVAVPLQATPLQTTDLPPALGATLISLGALLFLSAMWIAHRAAPRRGLAATTTALLLAGAVSGGAMRWRKMDRDFRANMLARPSPVNAEIRTEGEIHRLLLTPPADSLATWDTLVADHGKLMHFFLVREPGFTTFAHLHPARRDARSFEAVLPPLPPGPHQLYAELTHENGASETLVGRVEVPAPLGVAAQTAWTMAYEVWCQSSPTPAGNAAQPSALDPDDSWHAGPAPGVGARVSRLMGGGTMVFQNAGDIIADRETSLRFAVFTPGGEAATLQPYMGMAGHAVIRRSDGAVFTHLHPVGTISMAAQQIFTASTATRVPMSPLPGNEITFPYAFPRAGDYRVWVQVRLDGRVVTGVFDVPVKARN